MIKRTLNCFVMVFFGYVWMVRAATIRNVAKYGPFWGRFDIPAVVRRL